MTRVVLLAAESRHWTPASVILKPSPFFRRMTALQKAAVQAFSALHLAHDSLVEKAKALKAPLFYSSAYGELSAMLQVTKAIYDHDLPVSPKEFQHSVQNAALAYLSMTQELRHPCFALAGGFLSGDNCLQLAAQRIEFGLDSMAFVIHAHEYLENQTADTAQAEVLLLGTEDIAPFAPRLDFCRSGSFADFNEQSPEIFSEETSRISPWLLNQGRPYAARLVRSHSGESLVTQWNLNPR
jgi:hypothetical protein